MERGEWKELADIVPQGDGALVVSLASSPSRASGITNQELRTQWETTFKRNTKRWTAQQRDAHSTASLQRGSRSEGVALSPAASRREIARKKNESEDKREESDNEEERGEGEEEVVRKWVPSACTGAELRRRLTIEETIQLLSEEVNRCVLKSQAQLQHRRNLVASAGAGDPLFLPTPASPSSSSLQLLNSGEAHFHTTAAAMDKPHHQPLQLRPLRSPKEVLAGLGRSSGGSGKKAKAAGRKGRGSKTAGTDAGSCGGDLGGWDPPPMSSPPAGSEDEAKAAVALGSSRATVVVLRGEVPAPDVYYFAKRNVREGWLVKQGTSSLYFFLTGHTC
jgi:hypothetical protein